jgi:hypothetical protein
VVSKDGRQQKRWTMAQDKSTTLSWPAGREAIVVAVAKFEAVENEAMLRPPSRDSAKLPKLVPTSNLLAHVWNTLPSLHVPAGQIGIHPTPLPHQLTPVPKQLMSMTPIDPNPPETWKALSKTLFWGKRLCVQTIQGPGEIHIDV